MRPATFAAIRELLETLDEDARDAFFSWTPALAASPEARHYLLNALGREYARHPKLALIAAQWGDPAVVLWAASPNGNSDPSLAMHVLLSSSIPEAEEGIQRIADQGNATLQASLVEGLAESQRTDAVILVSRILARSKSDIRVAKAARRTLGILAYGGVAGAKALLARLPPEAPDPN